MTATTMLKRAQALAALAATTARDPPLIGDDGVEATKAATWHLRRAAVPGSVDNRIHAFGSGEQALGALDLCPVALLGAKAAGGLIYRQLLLAAEQDPGGSWIDHIRIVLQDRRLLTFCVQLGAYHRFQWKRAVYIQEVSAWQHQPVAHALDAPWRRRPVSKKQAYLIDDITECLIALRTDPPGLLPGNRGEAHDWLQAAGGRPVFWFPPTLPKLDLPRG